ncbi:MAG TPA: hypothetical protein VI072_09730 [Polyangiaceae bacterium]
MARRRLCAALGALLVNGCTLEATEEPESFKDCHFGELSGTWRIEYQDQRPPGQGCGQIPTQTGLLDEDSLGPGCQIDQSNVSPDKCQLDMQARCPTSDQLGTQTWIVRIRHVAVDELQGTGQLAINYPTGACQSTYAIKATKKE